MNISPGRNYWVFSSRHRGAYKGNVWDIDSILKESMYTLAEKEKNRQKVQPGDLVYMRTYGQGFIGKFTVHRSWSRMPTRRQKWKQHVVGAFGMSEIEVWDVLLPQSLVMEDLSNQDRRSRIIRLTFEDSIKIETAKRVYERLGFGSAGGEIWVLERGLEEAIKPNLKSLGLTLAKSAICQQCVMGIGVGRSDLICNDSDGNLVVLELKRKLTSDESVGQVLRYVGWLHENVANRSQTVSGWIVAPEFDEQIRLAAKAAGIRLITVRFG